MMSFVIVPVYNKVQKFHHIYHISLTYSDITIFSRPYTNGRAIGTVLRPSVVVCNVMYCG